MNRPKRRTASAPRPFGRTPRALLVIALLAGLTAAVFSQPAGAQSSPEPDSSLGAAATLVPFKTVSIPTTDPVADVEQSAAGYPLVAAGRYLYIYEQSGLFLTRFEFPTNILNVATAGGSVFVHESTTVHRFHSTSLAFIALYNGVANMSDQPVVGDHLVFVNTTNQFARANLTSGTTDTWAPPASTTAASIHARPGQARAVAVVNGSGTYQVVEYDNAVTPPTVVVDVTITGATLLGVTANGAAALFAIGTTGLRRVPFPVDISLTGTDITGSYPGLTGVSVTAGNGGWETYSTFAANATHYLVPAAAAAPLHTAGGHTAAQDAAWGPLGTQLAVVHSGSPKGLLSLYSVGARPAGAFSGSWGEYSGVTPWRALDTRNGTGAPVARIGPGGNVSVAVTGQGGVPATGVSSVVVNITLVAPSTDTYLTAYAAGSTPAQVSNVNGGPGQIRTNLAVVTLGSSGRIALFNAAGDTDALIDVMGYFSTTNGSPGGRYRALSPTRVLDTRETGNPAGPEGLLGVSVRGRLGIPSNVEAVAITLTAVDPTESTFITAFPSDAVRPEASNLNPPARTVVANSAFVRVGADGHIALFNAVGVTHLLVDVVGYWINDDSTEAGRYFNFSGSFRYYDSRLSSTGPLTLPSPRFIRVAGFPENNPDIPLPLDGGSSVLYNLTATDTSAASYMTAYPGALGLNLPNASTVNFAAGQTAASLTITGYGNDGSVAFYNAVGRAHFIVDMAGFFSSASL
ncbi:MAG: hypothetical protein ACKV2O_16805 [Acidimicrobiales bacterium]